MNVDPAESDLSHLDPQEIVAAVTSANGQRQAGSDFNAATPQDQESRQKVWWYLLLGALLLMAVETAMSNRLSRVSTLTMESRTGGQQWKAFTGFRREQSQLLGVVRGVREPVSREARAARRGDHRRGELGGRCVAAAYADERSQIRRRRRARGAAIVRDRRDPRHRRVGSSCGRCCPSSRDEQVALYLEEHEKSLSGDA